VEPDTELGGMIVKPRVKVTVTFHSTDESVKDISTLTRIRIYSGDCIVSELDPQ
jgi:hypothetical protein